MRKIFLILLFLPLSSYASFQLYGGMNIGSLSMDETSGANSYKHSSTFFVGHWGYGLGSRIKLDLGALKIGVVGDLSWNGDSIERKQNGVTHDATYRQESYRVLAGGTFSLDAGAFGLIGEYYPYVVNTVTYSDDKSENLFRKNDKFKGTGWGAGFQFAMGAGFYYSALYRQLIYKDIESNGTTLTLPNDNYSAIRVDDILVSAAKEF